MPSDGGVALYAIAMTSRSTFTAKKKDSLQATNKGGWCVAYVALSTGGSSAHSQFWKGKTKGLTRE